MDKETKINGKSLKENNNWFIKSAYHGMKISKKLIQTLKKQNKAEQITKDDVRLNKSVYHGLATFLPIKHSV